MEAIYPFSDLKTKQREVKDAALRDVVHVTENGKGAFVFCSEEIFESKLHAAAEEAAYAERVAAAVRRGRREIAEGKFVEGREAALKAIDSLAARND